MEVIQVAYVSASEESKKLGGGIWPPGAVPRFFVVPFRKLPLEEVLGPQAGSQGLCFQPLPLGRSPGRRSDRTFPVVVAEKAMLL